MECSFLIPIAILEGIGYFILWPVLKKRPKLAVPRQFSIADIAILFCYVQVAMALAYYQRNLLEVAMRINIAMTVLAIGAMVVWGASVSTLNQLQMMNVRRRLLFLLILIPGVLFEMVGLPVVVLSRLSRFQESAPARMTWMLSSLAVVIALAFVLRKFAAWLVKDAKDLSVPSTGRVVGSQYLPLDPELRPLVVVVDYDPTWITSFESLRRRLAAGLGDVATSIEHVGSTSVPGLAAKAIIDIGVIVPSQIEVAQAISRLAAIGYVHRGNLGIAGRETFRSPDNLLPHNLYVYSEGNLALANHLAVRDHLRSHPAAAAAYGRLKKELARKFPGDIDGYVDGKTDFLLAILRGAGLTDGQLAEIERANRKR